MIKKNKGFILVTTFVTLLPMFVGLFLWNQLPDKMPTHFNGQGIVDGYSGKPFAVIGIYLFCAAMHLLCAFVTAADPRKSNISQKIYRLILSICPLVSLFVAVTMYGTALNYKILSVDTLSILLVGVLYIVLGNYLPKCRQNYTIGIKLPWTLSNEDTWNYTHRMAGKWWIGGGILTILTSFQHLVDPVYIFIAITLIITLIPAVASYLYYRKHMGF